MSNFDWKKNIQDSVKDEWIITATPSFFCAKGSKHKTAKGIKLAGGICARVLVKDYARNESTSEKTKKKFKVPECYKITFQLLESRSGW